MFQLQNATPGDFDKKVSEALAIAARDTNQLLSTITTARLTAGNLGLRLKLKLDTLANLKLTEIQRLNMYLSGNDSVDSSKIIQSLSGFESQWVAIGEEIEILKNKL